MKYDRGYRMKLLSIAFLLPLALPLSGVIQAWRHQVSVPGANRGPHAGSPRGVVVATGSTRKSRFDRVAIAPRTDTLPATPAQDDDNWPPLSYLRHDYNQSKIVARVQVREAEIVNRIGGYEDWRLVCDVVEPFKGKISKGQEFVFYHGAEAGFKKETFLGDKIIFLIRNYVEKEKKWVYAVIENSTLAYNEDRGKKLRTIGRTSRRSRRKLAQRAALWSAAA